MPACTAMEMIAVQVPLTCAFFYDFSSSLLKCSFPCMCSKSEIDDIFCGRCQHVKSILSTEQFDYTSSLN